MADIETRVVISAQIDDLQSGMETAANSVQAATEAMRARFADMGTAAQQAQLQISDASALVGSSVGDLQEKTASLAGSIGAGITRDAGPGYAPNQQQQQLDEQAAAYGKFVDNVQTLDTRLADANKRAWDDMAAPVERAIDRSVTGIILGTTTVQKALANLAQSIVAEFVNSAIKGALGQIGNLWGTGALGGGGQDFSGGLDGAGEAVAGSTIAEGLGSDGLFGSSGIIAGFFKGVSALFGFEQGGIVPSAQGGWAVPSLGAGGVLAQLHSNEMVLPANISQGLQGMLTAPPGVAGSGGGGSGSVIVNVSAIDSQDVKRFFHSNGSLLVAALNKAVRNGSPLRTA
jgi:hypothetical protein